MHKHTFNPTSLRAYDIRGRIGETLTADDAYAIGLTFAANWLTNGDKVAIGYDGRDHSPMLADGLINGLNDGGVNVVNVEVCPTPQLYFATYHCKTDAGIMITGSHNPPEYNGFKIMLGGKPFFGSDIEKLGTLSNAGVKKAEHAGSTTKIDVRRDYINRIMQDAAVSNNLNIVWDAGNGSAGDAMVDLTNALPSTHILLNETIDGSFPNHHPDPTVAENLQQLIDCVRKNGCDAGIAFDGDGDRIGIVDDEGGIIWGDQLLLLYAQDLLKQRPNETIIADVKASQVLFDGIKAAGGNPLMWKTGHSHVKAKMADTNSPLAGEMSGHVFFKDIWYGFDDGLYAAVRFLNVLSKQGGQLSDWRKALPQTFATPELRFDCDDDKKFDVVNQIEARIKTQNLPASFVDGIRRQTENGWWLMRASNTQAALVARCESSTQDGLNALQQDLATYLTAAGVNADIF